MFTINNFNPILTIITSSRIITITVVKSIPMINATLLPESGAHSKYPFGSYAKRTQAPLTILKALDTASQNNL